MVKKRQRTNRRKKSYNPFKMWGAWVGGVIAILSSYGNGVWENFLGIIGFNQILVIPFLLESGQLGHFVYSSNMTFWISIILLGITGFLLGYAIHSLFRRFRK